MGTLDTILTQKPSETSAPAPTTKHASAKDMLESFKKTAAIKLAARVQELTDANCKLASEMEQTQVVFANYQRAVKIAHALLTRRQIEPEAFLNKVAELLTKNMDVVEEAIKLGSYSDSSLGSIDREGPMFLGANVLENYLLGISR